MRKYFFSVLFGVLFSVPAFGCLNGETLHLEDGTILYEDYEGYVPYGHSFTNTEELNKILLSLEKGYRETGKLNYLSDKGLILIIQGKYKEAIELYKKIEKEEPNRYSTASNIGTAYELIGNNAEALRWIEKAVKINPNSHYGSEWIHINILKAKMKGGKLINSRFLIGNDFGNGKFPESERGNGELFVLRKQLYYQLNERVSFVKPKDKIVAQLLFDLGNISYLMQEKEEAAENYKMAKEYGFNKPVLEERLALYMPPIIDNVQKKAIEEIKFQTKPVRRTELISSCIAVVYLLFSGVIVFVLRKKIF